MVLPSSRWIKGWPKQYRLAEKTNLEYPFLLANGSLEKQNEHFFFIVLTAGEQKYLKHWRLFVFLSVLRILSLPGVAHCWQSLMTKALNIEFCFVEVYR